MSDRSALKLRPGLVAGGTVALALAVGILSEPEESPAAVPPPVLRLMGDAERPKAGETVRYDGDGFARAWRVVDSQPDVLLLRRGEDLTYVSPFDVARAD